MIRLINDDKVIDEMMIRRIENKIFEVAKFLEKQPEFFTLSKLVFETRLANTKLWEEEHVMILYGKNRVPWSTVISEYANNRIEYNPKKFKNMSLPELVGNIVHETLHSFGFSHEFNWNKTRKYSTPYYVGYLFQYIAHNYDAFTDDKAEHLNSLLTGWRDYINEWVK